MNTRLLLAIALLNVAASAQGTASSFGDGCPPGADAVFGFAPNPGAGRVLLYQTNVAPTAVPIAILGFSATHWNGVPLPAPLDGIGLPGCTLLTQLAITANAHAIAGGVAEYSVNIPADATLAGLQLYGQWLNWGDASVSATLPLTLSNGVHFQLGSDIGMPGFVVTGDPTAPSGATWSYSATIGGVSYDLNGRLYKPSTPPAGGHLLYPAVVISHGYGGNANGYSAAIASTMRSWGLVCIMTNLTHAGGVPLGSPGLATERGASDANVLRNRKCIDLVQSLGYVDMRRLAAHGHSMGAFATGALLGTHPELFMVGSHTAGGMSTQPSAAATSVAQAMGIVAPYQLHHGDADTVVPLIQGQALANQLAANPTVHEFLVYSGFTHSQIALDANMLATVNAWYVAHGLLP